MKYKIPRGRKLNSILIADWDPFFAFFLFFEEYNILYNPPLKENNLIDITERNVLKEDIKRVGNEI